MKKYGIKIVTPSAQTSKMR